MQPGGALPSNLLHLLQSRQSSICHVSAEEANGMLCPPGSQLTRRYMTLLLFFFFLPPSLIFLPSQVEGLSRPRRGGGVGVTIISVCGFLCGVWCTAVFKLEALFRSPAHCPVIYLFFFFTARCRKCLSLCGISVDGSTFSDKAIFAQTDFSSLCFSHLFYSGFLC